MALDSFLFSQKWSLGLSLRQALAVRVPPAVSLPCRAGADWVWVLERADRMLSGVMSTFERILARGLWDAVGAGAGVFRPLERLPGLVGVPGEGLDAGLTPGGRKIDSSKCNSKWLLNPWYFPLKIFLWLIHKWSISWLVTAPPHPPNMKITWRFAFI